jgi:hypothetical protein
VQGERAATIQARLEATGISKSRAQRNTLPGGSTAGKPAAAASSDGDDVDFGGDYDADKEVKWDDATAGDAGTKKGKPKSKKGAAQTGARNPSQDEDERITKRMAHKLNFLRNPRHVRPPPAAPATSAATVSVDGGDSRVSAGRSVVGPPSPPPHATASTASSSPRSQPRSMAASAVPETVSVAGSMASTVHVGDTSAAVVRAGAVHVTASGEGAAGPFSVNPGRVHFGSFVVDKESVTVVTIRNQDAVSRSLRIIPPATPLFSIDAPVYPGKVRGEGMIAPGMSMKVTLRFLPDSAGDAADALTLVTDTGSFKLPITAGLPAPMLTLPLDVHAGCCLQGDVVDSTIVVVNSGEGAGRYRVFADEAWPSAAAGPATADDVVMGPFTVSPSAFQLAPRQRLTVRVRFSPPSVGTFTRAFVVVCDNCDVTRHSISGTSVPLDVRVSGVQGRAVAAGPAEAPAVVSGSSRGVGPETVVVHSAEVDGTLRDGAEIDASHAPVRLRFDAWYAGSTSIKTVSVRNVTPLPLRFTWDRGAGALNGSDVFTVSPASGSLPANSVTDFHVSCTPLAPLAYAARLSLVIEDVPVVGERLAKARKVEERKLRGTVTVESPGGPAPASGGGAGSGGDGGGATDILRERVEVAAVYAQVCFVTVLLCSHS